jgi:hypothetical protein
MWSTKLRCTQPLVMEYWRASSYLKLKREREREREITKEGKRVKKQEKLRERERQG